MSKTLKERYGDEVLTDNSKIKYCEQCKECKKWGNSKTDYFSNAYNKSSCDAYPYPLMKPQYVINNENNCDYRET